MNARKVRNLLYSYTPPVLFPQRFVSLFFRLRLFSTPPPRPVRYLRDVGLSLDPTEAVSPLACLLCFFTLVFAQTVCVCQCRRPRSRRRRLRPISRYDTRVRTHTDERRRCLRPSAPLPADSGSRLLLKGELRSSVPLHVEVEEEEGEKRKEPIAQNGMGERTGEGGRLKKEEASPCLQSGAEAASAVQRGSRGGGEGERVSVPPTNREPSSSSA